jgi:hypothetical protein
MGTRHLTCIFADGEYRLCHYGQWDGYPSGQGAVITDFLLSKYDPEKFKEHALLVEEFTQSEIDSIYEDHGAEPGSTYVSCAVADAVKAAHPELSRDTGAKILELIAEKKGLKVPNTNDSSFAKDSLFCEWAYVLDLDRNKLEVYKGFNKSSVPEGERFAGPQKTTHDDEPSEYHPVKFFAEVDLTDREGLGVFVKALEAAKNLEYDEYENPTRKKHDATWLRLQTSTTTITVRS